MTATRSATTCKIVARRRRSRPRATARCNAPSASASTGCVHASNASLVISRNSGALPPGMTRPQPASSASSCWDALVSGSGLSTGPSNLAMTAPIWRPAAQAVAVWLAQALTDGLTRKSRISAHFQPFPAPRRTWQGRQSPILKTCIECGKAFSVKHRKFCSDACMASYRMATTMVTALTMPAANKAMTRSIGLSTLSAMAGAYAGKQCVSITTISSGNVRKS